MKESRKYDTKCIKIILLGSGYNELQEGQPRPIKELSEPMLYKHVIFATRPDNKGNARIDDINKDIAKDAIYIGVYPRANRIGYVNYTNQTFQIGSIRTQDLGLKKKGDFLDIALSETIKDPDFQSQIRALLTERRQIDINPFTSKAAEEGFVVDIESVDYKSLPSSVLTDSSSGKMSFGELTRTRANLDPKNPEELLIRDSLIDKWRADSVRYDGVVFINADGVGWVESTYWPIYFEFEESQKFYFADWCTCCTPPTKTSQFFVANPGERETIKNTGKARTLPFIRAQRSASIGGSLEEDFTQWLQSIKAPAQSSIVKNAYQRFGLLCAPCVVFEEKAPATTVATDNLEVNKTL